MGVARPIQVPYSSPDDFGNPGRISIQSSRNEQSVAVINYGELRGDVLPLVTVSASIAEIDRSLTW